jgi:hypothetical protein
MLLPRSEGGVLLGIITSLLYIVESILLAPVALAADASSGPAPGYSAICLVARDENIYLREWIEYHTLCLGNRGVSGAGPRAARQSMYGSWIMPWRGIFYIF